MPSRRRPVTQRDQAVAALVGDGDGVAGEPPQAVRDDDGERGYARRDDQPLGGRALGAEELEVLQRGHFWDGSSRGAWRRGSVAPMCGRYAASRRPEDLAGVFESTSRWESGADRWSPTGTWPRPKRSTSSWSALSKTRRPRAGSSAAQAEVGTRPVLGEVARGRGPDDQRARRDRPREALLQEGVRRPPLHHPADGYYEWVTGAGERELEVEGKKKRPRKQPYFVTPADGSVFAMAGLYEFWRDRTLPDDHPSAWWVTCSVVTTEAETGPLGVAPAEGPALARRHPPPDAADADPGPLVAWLDPARTDMTDAAGLLAPPPGGLMRAYPGVDGRQQRTQQRARAAEGTGGARGGHAVLSAVRRRSLHVLPSPRRAWRQDGPVSDSEIVQTGAGDGAHHLAPRRRRPGSCWP